MYAKWFNTLVISLFVILISAQAGKRFVLDEIDFPAVAHATSETGIPVYYRGEDNPKHIGIYHPPLYIYSLAGFIKAFGYSENIIRTFGMICTLVTAFLCTLIFGQLFSTKLDREYFNLVFLPLFLLHPYTLANTTLPDIDQTVLPVTFLAFIYFQIKLFNSDKPNEQSKTKDLLTSGPILTLSLLFALNLWAKMTTSLALLPIAAFIFMAIGNSLYKSITIVVKTALIGGFIFLATYWVYCHFFSLPFDYTFQFLFHSFTKGTSSPGSLLAILGKVTQNFSYVKQFANWLTLPFLFVLFISLAFLITKKKRTVSEDILLIMSLFGIFISIFYLGLISPFGHFFKYPYPVFPLLIMAVAYFISKHLFASYPSSNTDANALDNSPSTKITASHLSIGLVFFVVFFPVSLYQLYVARDLAIFVDRPVETSLLIAIVGVAFLLGSLISLTQFHREVKYLVSILLAVTLGVQLGISRSQAVAVYPTKYEYGQTGLNDTVAYLKGKVRPNEVIWSMKDVGYYVNNKYIENYTYIFDPAVGSKLRDLIKHKQIRYFVVTKGIGEDRIDVYPLLKEALDSCCTVDKEFGNFVIYKAKIL